MNYNKLSNEQSIRELMKVDEWNGGKHKKIIKKFKYIFIGIIITCIILQLYLYFIINHKLSNNINKYYNLAQVSNFSGKDQIELNDNNFNINHLIEQALYIKLKNKDKDKYLNLPENLKDKVINEYIINNI